MMWYKAATFQEREQEAYRAFDYINTQTQGYSYDMSVLRLWHDEQWVVVAYVLMSEQQEPPARLQTVILQGLRKGKLIALDEKTLEIIRERGNERTRGRTRDYISHTPSLLLSHDETPAHVDTSPASPQFEISTLTRVNTSRPFLIRYREAYERLHPREAIARMFDIPLEATRNMVNAHDIVYRATLSRLHPYLFDETALRMHSRVYEPHEYTLHRLPAYPVWIELPAPLVSEYGDVKAFCMYCMGLTHIEDTLTSELRAMIASHRESLSHVWRIEAIADDKVYTHVSKETWDAHTRSWVYRHTHVCPYDRCTLITDVPADSMPYYLPCEYCEKKTRFFSSWLRTALLMIGRYYATSPTPAPFETTTLCYDESERVSRAHSKKKRTIIHHKSITYTLVSYDVSEKTHTLSHPTSSTRGSWLASHERDEILYIARSIEPYERRYPSRKNGTRQEGLVHVTHQKEKYIPVLKERRVIQHVTARKYASEKESERTSHDVR